MNRVGVFGANGRMGLALLEAATINKNSQLAAAYVRSESELVGLSVNQLNSAAAKDIHFSMYCYMRNQLHMIVSGTHGITTTVKK